MQIIFITSSKYQISLLPHGAQSITIHKPTSLLEPLSAIFLNKYKPDIVFSPMQTIGTLFKKYKIILTIHDLIYYTHPTPPRDLNPFIKALWRLYHTSYLPAKMLLGRADAVATVSHSTKAKITQHKLTRGPIFVIPNAHNHTTLRAKPTNLAQPSTHSSHTKREGAPSPKSTNIIYMGSFAPYKRVHLLIKSMSYLSQHTLHLLSKIDPKTHKTLLSIMQKTKNINPKQIRFHNGITDEKYMQILSSPNSILASASADEGYGIPVAEALSCRCPAVLTNIPAFREVAGPGAVYFHDQNSQDQTAYNIAKAIQYLSQPHNRTRYANAGFKHISQASWQQSAQKLLNACKALHHTKNKIINSK